MRKRVVTFLGVLIATLLSIIVFSQDNVFSLDDGMVIKEMNINVNVTEDNIYNVTEEIKVNFLQERHGIFRNIPVTKATLSVKSVTNELGNSYKYDIESEGQDKVLKIGDEDKTVYGDVTYIINYEISYKGSLSDLSYNIVGPEWDTTIDKVNFTINMPKPFSSNEIRISSGKRGTVTNDLVSFRVDGNSIIGETTSQLSPNEGITIEIPVGDSYFAPPKLFNLYTIIAILVVTLVPLLGIKASLFYNKKKKIVNDNSTKVIGFYPPDGFNPIDLAYIAYPNKRLTPEELTSIIFYYGNKGFIEIHNINGEYELRKCRNVTIKDFQNKYEYDFFKNLFDLSEKKNGIVNVKDFKRSKLGFMGSFIDFSRSENLSKARYIEDLSTNFNMFAYMSALLLSIVGLVSYMYSISYDFGFAVLWCVGTLIFSVVILVPISFLLKKINFSLNMIVIALILPSIMYFVLNLDGMSSILIGSIPAVTVYIYFCISVAISQSMPSTYVHTVNGVRVLGETEGYKEFIKTAKKDELEMLVKDNPSYYYDVLPYAICLGITDIFEDKFKELKYYEPQWYYGNSYNNVFLYHAFATNYSNKLTNEYKEYVREQQAERSASSSGGGGGAGGGSVGGGGGGSW